MTKLFEVQRCYTSEYGDPGVERNDLFMAPNIEAIRKRVDDDYKWESDKKGGIYVFRRYEGYPSHFLYYMRIREVVFGEPDEDGISTVVD